MPVYRVSSQWKQRTAVAGVRCAGKMNVRDLNDDNEIRGVTIRNYIMRRQLEYT